MLDRDKALNWWTGRISDAQIAEWTGMPSRAVTLVLNLPRMRAGVAGGGRGSRHSRRVHPKTRNAVAIVHALSEAGLAFELASNILEATPVLASGPTEVVDFSPIGSGVRSMIIVDPAGNWLPGDIVPDHVWERFVIPCRAIDNPSPGSGDISYVRYEAFQPDARGVMVVDRSAIDMPNLELVPLVDRPVYSGECDPTGFYLYDNFMPDASAAFDHHLLIVDGRWIFQKSPDPQPLQAMQQLWQGIGIKERGLEFRYSPFSVIEPDKKTVRVIGWGRDEDEQELARYHLQNPTTLLDVNMTLAVRKMKRRAYGLPVGRPEKPMAWAERVTMAQRYSPTKEGVTAQ
jgi:hypothetical protein